MYPGTPCHYVGDTGCTIYESRPDVPCGDFNCAWKLDANVPEWMRPDLVKMLMVADYDRQTGEDIIREEVKRDFRIEVISWFKVQYKTGQIKKPDDLSEEEFLKEIDYVVKNFSRYIIILNHHQKPIPDEKQVILIKKSVDQMQTKSIIAKEKAP